MKRRDNIDRMNELMDEMRKGESQPKLKSEPKDEPKEAESSGEGEGAEDKPKRKKKVVEQE